MTTHRLGVALIITVMMILLHFTSQASSSGDSEKVNVSLYYEALCPYCSKFIVNNLSNIFDNGLVSIINLRLVPWGNTVIVDDSTWNCQHGPDECMLDTVQACAIRVWPDKGAHYNFRFIKCIERLHLENKHSQWQSCFRSQNLDSKPVTDCYNSGAGFQLEQSYAEETKRLNPPHKYVPWVVVDNQPLQEDYENFEKYVCRAYKGHNLPTACRTLAAAEIKSPANVKPAGQVCYDTPH